MVFSTLVRQRMWQSPGDLRRQGSSSALPQVPFLPPYTIVDKSTSEKLKAAHQRRVEIIRRSKQDIEDFKKFTKTLK